MASRDKDKGKSDLHEAVKPNSVMTIKGDTPTIIIPKTMTKPSAAQELMRQHEEEQKISVYSRVFNGYYYEDVMVAIKKSFEQHFGWVNSQVVRTFFGDIPPRIMEVVTDVLSDGSKVTERAFMGRLVISQWADAQADTQVKAPFMAGLTVKTKKMYEDEVTKLFDLIEKVLRTDSIFKGKSVVVEYKAEGDESSGKYAGINMDITHISTNPNIVLNEDTDRVVNTLIGADLKGKRKRIYLFTGSYGNGKTETCLTLGNMAVGMGYTFMYVKSPAHLSSILLAAKHYLPALVFMEDIDQVASGTERSDVINEVLNTLDGTELKGKNIKVLFTTNHPSKLNEALRRPGRIDIVVRFDNPDVNSKAIIIEKLLRNVPGYDSLDVMACAKHLPQVQGAFIAEICSRAAQYSETIDGGLTTDLFKSASTSMEDHIALMNEKVDDGTDKLHNAVKMLGSHLFNGNISSAESDIQKQLRDLARSVKELS